MKKILFLTVAMSGILFVSKAQNGDFQRQGDWSHKRGGQMGRMGKMGPMGKMGMMAKELNLTDAQKKQEREIAMEFRKKREELNKNENITVKEQRERRQQLMKEQREKMQNVLTPEQKNKIAQMKEARKAKGEEMFNNHLNKMKTLLDLTDNQVAQIKAQRTSNEAAFKAIREDKNLDRMAKAEKMKALRKQNQEAHKKIFTPEQLKKMEAMKDMHRGGDRMKGMKGMKDRKDMKVDK